MLLLLLALSALTQTTLLPSIKSARCPIKLPQDPPNPPPSTRQPNTTSRTTPRIVNGDLLSANLVPYMVTTLGDSLCTATLISATWYVTAAHCKPAPGDRVQLGASIRGQGSITSVRTVTSAYIHPSYVNIQQGGQYDIAVVQFAPPASTDSRFMKVNVNTEYPYSNTFARVMGYGVVEFEGDVDGVARQVDVPVTSQRACLNAYDIDTDLQFCAGYVSSGGCDACQGDSGGPIIQYDATGQPALIGVVSSGRGCGDSGFPGIYIRVAALESFLDAAGAQYEKSTQVSPVFREQSSLNVGTIVAIVIAAIAVLILSALVVSCFVRKRRNNTPTADIPAAPPAPGIRPEQAHVAPQAPYQGGAYVASQGPGVGQQGGWTQVPVATPTQPMPYSAPPAGQHGAPLVMGPQADSAATPPSVIQLQTPMLGSASQAPAPPSMLEVQTPVSSGWAPPPAPPAPPPPVVE